MDNGQANELTQEWNDYTAATRRLTYLPAVLLVLLAVLLLLAVPEVCTADYCGSVLSTISFYLTN